MTAGTPSSSAATRRQPPPAERARTVAARPGASLHAAGLGVCQLWGATTTASGDVLLVVPADGAVTAALARSPLGDVPARLTVTDRAPVPLRRPVRGLVELSGWITPVDDGDVPRLLLDYAEAHPCDALFEVGLGAALVRLDLAEVVLEEAGTTTDVDPDEFVAARPDPVSAAERELMATEQPALDRLTARVRCWADRRDDVALLGLDRYGVRFRVQGRDGCYDLRVPFEDTLTGPADVRGALTGLLSC
ncbi:DUF2470 domain-containing protein [Blastococcus sp. TF02A-30]|uniref:DUF2470 domain-containing protein n=1 Tax=Blastococcus sp. TF02A-30 TaxID=2250580 RepID=UPI000DEB9344|nr:DUF2470 domain-containing protein [Blastococcus sp. TF02A-30]RBY92534.1 DUF2470 domain-containing protein [Blastococcus sp. TF02A-30]